MTRVLVVGCTGQLGADLLEAFAADDVRGVGHEDIELRDRDAVVRVLRDIQPRVVVNTAAFHHVPRCEEQPATAYEVNAVGAKYLAEECAEAGRRLVYVSTDYVFDGQAQRPYVETDRPNPLNTYGLSKLAGEHAVLNSGGDHQVVRTSGLYGRRPCRAKGGNFIDTMFTAARERDEVRVVDDEILTPTYTMDLAKQIRALAFAGPPGLFHATSQGSCSWYEFARVIFEVADLRTPLCRTSTAAFPSTVKRPGYSVLDNAALRAAGLDGMRSWREALTDYLGYRLGISPP